MTDATMDTQKDAAQVKRYVVTGAHWFYEVGSLKPTEDFITGDRNPAFVLASDYDLVCRQRDDLKARVEALELAMQTAINEIHYDDDSASAEKTLRKALAGDRP